MDMRQAVKYRIDEARLLNSRYLDLSYTQLSDIPEEVYSLEDLESLFLSGNDIRVIPERLHNLANLKLVDVVGNPIERCAGIAGLILDWQGYLRLRATIQSTAVIRLYLDMTRDVGQASDLLQIGRLTALRSLYVTGDYDRPVTEAVLAPMVSGIGELKNLQHLEFDGVRMQTLPEPIKRLKSLHTLVVANGGLPEVPRWISDLTALRTLDLRSNEISGLPDTAGKMVSLERLVLSKNPLADFPEPIFRMKALEGLVLSARDGSAYIREIPPEIVALENLKQLDIDGHPIETPPPEVVDRGAESVKNYWRQRQEVGIDYLCEAKLIIVGEAGAGKTSLARKIEDREYELQDRQPSTEGIEVIPWSFRAAIRVSEGDREKLLERDFRVRIWDFGGQEVYHATHQFFLTHRSVYVLVADERKEDTDFNYWLRVVDLLSGSSPLLIVQNLEASSRKARTGPA
jgi:internalin A